MLAVLHVMGKISILTLFGIVLGCYGLYALALKPIGRKSYE